MEILEISGLTQLFTHDLRLCTSCGNIWCIGFCSKVLITKLQMLCRSAESIKLRVKMQSIVFLVFVLGQVFLKFFLMYMDILVLQKVRNIYLKIHTFDKATIQQKMQNLKKLIFETKRGILASRSP